MTSPTMDPSTSSAWAMLQAQLDAWGLGSLSSAAQSYLVQGYTMDSIPTLLQQTPEYKARFSANDARVKAGLPVLSPAEYVSTEASYRQVLQQFGLPPSFYDNSSDFAEFIAKDISPDEVKQRASDAQSVWLSTDSATRQAWTQMYGLTDGAAIAAILDPERAMPIVQRMTNAAQIGGAALQNGLGVDQSRFEQYADLGVTQAQAQKGFGQIATSLPYDQQMAARFGTSFTQQQAEQATLLNQGPAARQQAAIEDAEKQLFGARGSADQNTTSTRPTGSY